MMKLRKMLNPLVTFIQKLFINSNFTQQIITLELYNK
jgi:hypothetical protein